jgi:hypothetical protein
MKRLLLLTIAAAAFVVPSTALAGGVVLKVDRAAHLVAVAQTKTKVALVHTSAASKLHVGQRVAMQARALRNGTYSAAGVRVVGRASKVSFRALLLEKTSTRYVVTAGGAVIALHRGRSTASASDGGTPAPGTTIQVTATVGQNDDLDEDQMTTVSADHPGGAIEGVLTLGNGTITVVSEHLALVLNVPAGFDLSSFQNGDQVLAVFAQQPDGTLLLTSLSGDQSAQQADHGRHGEDGGGHDGHGDDGGGDDGGGGGGGSVGGNGGANPGATVGING